MRAEDTGLAKALCPPMTEEMRKEFLEQLQIAMDSSEFTNCVHAPHAKDVNIAISWAATPQGHNYWNNWDKVTRA